MTSQEKAELLEQIKNLPEANKNFVLGYAAGVTAKQSAQQSEKSQKSA